MVEVNHPTDDGPWRQQAQYFRTPRAGDEFTPGSVAFSPGWFAQAHNVLSVLLRKADSVGREWLEAMVEPHIIISGMLHVMHPQLYSSGIASLQALRSDPSRAAVVNIWSNPFNALSVMLNRRSRLHQDRMSSKEWYDMLLSVGGDPQLVIRFPTIPLVLPYKTGTIASFSGARLPHEVPESQAERVCVAYYMRPNIHAWARVAIAGWRYLWD
ncbi:uncharacterized protein B0H18DRAFT_889505 [Fomitopsis serialis]|uniref:uncharacterized protein n=1 Tax=Fomitopsis serialis TaxID=139415 RepID=UPI00200893FF|nr:uncharacterized protein B0H18DRAFT_889505 [Neoantrodia serialis]KAH9912667.1 hypothetical protein B0H18DRAFT_889505 [Neoantrodia serialis]